MPDLLRGQVMTVSSPHLVALQAENATAYFHGTYCINVTRALIDGCMASKLRCFIAIGLQGWHIHMQSKNGRLTYWAVHAPCSTSFVTQSRSMVDLLHGWVTSVSHCNLFKFGPNVVTSTQMPWITLQRHWCCTALKNAYQETHLPGPVAPLFVDSKVALQEEHVCVVYSHDSQKGQHF